MFNMIFSLTALSFLAIQAFFALFCVRLLFFKKKIAVVSFHFLLFLGLFIVTIGGGGIQNDDYEGLKKLKALEENNTFNSDKTNFKDLHWKGFETSKELQEYIESHDPFIDKAEAIAVGWFFVLCADIAMVFVSCFLILWRRIKGSSWRVKKHECNS